MCYVFFSSRRRHTMCALVSGVQTCALPIGSFYLRRGKGDAPRLVDRLATYLRDGGSVALFPEGTTSDGRNMRRFQGRMFAAAIEARCKVQPIALRYHPVDGRDLAPFVGDDDLLTHVLRLLRAPRVDADHPYCPPIDARGCDGSPPRTDQRREGKELCRTSR